MTLDQKDKEKVAAVGFAAFLMMALGPVGLVLAAIAVGTERAWTGRMGAEAAGGGPRLTAADHRAWLKQDAAERKAWREARRRWWDDGADPDLEPKRRTGRERLGRWFRRLWARISIADDNFRRGAKQGWDAAKEAQGRGDKQFNWRDVPDDDLDFPEDGSTVWDEDKEEEDPDPDVSREWSREERDLPPPPRQPFTTPTPHDADSHSQPQDATERAETMTATTTAPSQGETNLDHTVADLDSIGALMRQAEDLNDQLAEVARKAEEVARRAAERAQATGGTTATNVALDATQAAAAAIQQQAGRLADLTSEAADSASAASSGLKPAQDAQDQLQSAGARGEFVDTATAHA